MSVAGRDNPMLSTSRLFLLPLLAASACGGPGDLFNAGRSGDATGGKSEDAGAPSASDAGAGQAHAGASGETEPAGSGGAAVSGAGNGGSSGGSKGGTGNAGTGNAGATGSGGKSGVAGGGTGGGTGAGGMSGASGAAGSGGSGAACPASCDVNADCSIEAGEVVCACHSGFVGDGNTCKRPASCNELHVAAPSLPSGSYTLKPSASGAEFLAYCEMSAECGGWTLVLNAGKTFDRSVQGTAMQCYDQNCTSLSYSTVPLAEDVMLDVRDGAITAADYTARVIIKGVHPATRGKTLRTLFNSGPNYLEKEDNSNLTVRLNGGTSCGAALPEDMARAVCSTCAGGPGCGTPVLVFDDTDPGCGSAVSFAIGAAESYTAPWGNCAGWPEAPDIGGRRYYPTNFRIWIR